MTALDTPISQSDMLPAGAPVDPTTTDPHMRIEEGSPAGCSAGAPAHNGSIANLGTIPTTDHPE